MRMNRTQVLFWYSLLFTVYHFVTSCGQEGNYEGRNGKPGQPGPEGKPGTDGTNGETGRTGNPGTPGEQGNPGTVGPGGDTGTAGKNGTDGRDGAPGEAGADGHDGAAGTPGSKGDTGEKGSDGATGEPGYSIVSLTETVAVGDIFCTEGGTRIRLAQDTNRNDIWDVTDRSQSMFSVCHGRVGPAGPAIPLEILDPCGDDASITDEVLVRLTDGRLLASFSENANGKNTRFSLLGASSYITTDGSQCYFSVNAAGELYNEHH